MKYKSGGLEDYLTKAGIFTGIDKKRLTEASKYITRIIVLGLEAKAFLEVLKEEDKIGNLIYLSFLNHNKISFKISEKADAVKPSFYTLGPLKLF